MFVLALPVISVALTVYYGAKLMAAHWAAIAKHVKNVALVLRPRLHRTGLILASRVVGLCTSPTSE